MVYSHKPHVEFEEANIEVSILDDFMYMKFESGQKLRY